MAIALPYYYSLTDLPQSAISAVWYEQAATGSGNFSLNSTGSISSVLNNSGSDFTLICTIDRLKSSLNTGSVQILAGAGWTFGIDYSNFFFIQASGEAYTFDKINLGRKTCFSLIKNGSAFSVTNFNVPSQVVESTQTQFFNPNINVTGTGLSFAGGNVISGVRNFYGTVDQLLLLNQPISENALNTLFSGFLQQNLTTTPASNVWGLTYSNWENESAYSGQLVFLQSGANYFSQDVLSNFNTSGKSYGGYYGEMTFTPGYTEITKIDPVAFVNPCTTFGVVQIATHSMGGISGLPTSFNVPVFVNYANPSLFSFDFSALTPGMSLDLTYTLTGAQSNVITQNTGYYSGFVMNGVNVPDTSFVRLGYFPTGMNSINQIGISDLVRTGYFAPGAVSGDTIYIDGVANSGYVKNGDYIYPISGGISGRMIYDKIPQNQFIALSTATGTAATGNYYNKTSVVFSGSGNLRTVDYLETHQYHLYHNKNIPTEASGEIYANTDLNWQ